MNPWECPRCHKINSPKLMQCFCEPIKETLCMEKFLSPNATVCLHEWDYSQVLTSYPAKMKCKKCGALTISPLEGQPML